MTMSDFPLACPEQKTDPFSNKFPRRQKFFNSRGELSDRVLSFHPGGHGLHPTTPNETKNLMDEAWAQAKQTEVEGDLWRLLLCMLSSSFLPTAFD